MEEFRILGPRIAGKLYEMSHFDEKLQVIIQKADAAEGERIQSLTEGFSSYFYSIVEMAKNDKIVTPEERAAISIAKSYIEKLIENYEQIHINQVRLATGMETETFRLHGNFPSITIAQYRYGSLALDNIRFLFEQCSLLTKLFDIFFMMQGARIQKANKERIGDQSIPIRKETSVTVGEASHATIPF